MWPGLVFLQPASNKYSSGGQIKRLSSAEIQRNSPLHFEIIIVSVKPKELENILRHKVTLSDIVEGRVVDTNVLVFYILFIGGLEDSGWIERDEEWTQSN